VRFKLDENADPRWAAPLVAAGHDVDTVAGEGLQGADDGALAAACLGEARCLLTLDLDFAQVLTYPPARYPGIVVLRHPRPTLAGLLSLVRQVVALLGEESPAGSLWIVEPGRVRVHDPESGEEPEDSAPREHGP